MALAASLHPANAASCLTVASPWMTTACTRAASAGVVSGGRKQPRGPGGAVGRSMIAENGFGCFTGADDLGM